MRKFQSQLDAAAQAWARERMLGSNISELRTQGVPFQVGGVEDGPEVEEEHSCDAAAIHVGLRVCGWVGDLDVGTDDPETN